jgi:AsmA family protein
MPKRRNLVLGSILAAVIVVGGGAMAAYTLASPERVKEIAQRTVHDRWGRDLRLGAVEVKLLPRPSVHATDASVEGLGSAKSMTATLQVFPLLFGHVRPAHVLVQDGEFREWHIDRASFDSALDWRGATIDANVSRNGQTAHVKGKFADLSRIGKRGEKTRGKVEIEWGETQVAADGDFRLDGLRGNALRAVVRTGSLDDVFAFVGIDRDRTAPLEVTADVRDEGDVIHLDNVRLKLGAMHAEGDGTITTTGDKPVVDAKLHADRFDWKQALQDMGHAPKPKEDSPYIFRDRKLAWKTLTHLRGLRGKVEATADWARLGNGIELQGPRANFTFDDDRVQLDLWQTRLLGGTGHGNMRFDAARKTIHFEGTGENLLLQRWFHERGRDHNFTGGPMQVSMSLDMRGDTWRDLAASVTGPVRIRMGPGVYAREKAGEWEALMASFSRRNSHGTIDFECAAANLNFDSGVARGDSIVGARSTVSRLLTSGVIDMREEHVDLRGKLRTRSDKVGLSTIADDLQVEGPLRKMKMRLDPAKKPETVAKGIAAVATAGLSILATKAAEAHRDDPDPCSIVPVQPAAAPKPRAQAHTAMSTSR